MHVPFLPLISPLSTTPVNATLLRYADRDRLSVQLYLFSENYIRRPQPSVCLSVPKGFDPSLGV